MNSMNSNTPAIDALILVPIAIVASVAFLAVKSTHCYKYIVRYLRSIWANYRPRSHLLSFRRNCRRKDRHSDIYTSQIHADSWADLESIRSREVSHFINQSQSREGSSGGEPAHSFTDTPSRVWHPNRATRLAWSFTNPRSRSRSHYALSNVAKPLPVVQRPERSDSPEDDTSREHQMRVRGARLQRRTGP